MTIKNELDHERNLSVNDLDNALVVMHNQLARKQTSWNVRETKLFYASLSQIKWRNNENWVCLKKSDIVDKLEIDKRDTNKLRKMYEDVLKKSYVKFGADDEDWNDGFLLTNIKTTRNEVFVKFSEEFLPLLDQLTSHFTMFELDNIAHFKSKYAIILFQYLKSWYNPQGMINHRKISLNELKRMFELEASDYVRKGGLRDGIFDTTNFKKKTLDKAVEEINKDIAKSGMKIDKVETVKHRGMVAGYDIAYSLIVTAADGHVGRYNDESNKRIADGQFSIDDF